MINGIGTVTVLGGSQRAFRHGHRPSKTATRYQYQSPSYTRDRTLTSVGKRSVVGVWTWG